jgi:hypothetical protein
LEKQAVTQDPLEMAKRDLKQIVKELGVPAISNDRPLTRFERFGEAVAKAYIDRSRVERRGRFELPDGTVYTMISIGGKTRCFMSGPVSSPSGKSSGPLTITCPSNAAWEFY